MRFRLSAPTKVSLALVCLTVSTMLVAQSFGLLPDRTAAVLEGRKKLSESVAVQCSLSAQKNDFATIRTVLRAAVDRNEDVLSAGFRSASGKLLSEIGDHEAQWIDAMVGNCGAQVPVFRGDKPFGTVEIRFASVEAGGFTGFLSRPLVRLIGFVAASGFASYWLFMKRTLRHLDPSSVIPKRVRATLDALAEGVLVLDKDQRVMLANAAFAATVGRSESWLLGRKAPALGWTTTAGEEVREFPWAQAISDGAIRTGVPLVLTAGDGRRRTLAVNVAPIVGSDGAKRGVLATFDDMTEMEEKNARLQELLKLLKQSRDEVNRQNQQLQLLARQDSLTGCLNRRAFFEQLELDWEAAKRYGHRLGCVMIDVDHFKQINDTHGHKVGDLVLQGVAGALQAASRKSDLLCRYGGEEFCIVIPQGGMETAAAAGERFRAAIEALSSNGVKVTVSVGVSSMELGANSHHELLDQADKALYAAKNGGRNRIIRWDALPADFRIDQYSPATEGPPAGGAGAMPIPLHAVNALLSVLGHRDPATLEHCKQVADLCALVSSGLMSPSDSFILEVAAQLHDIGKLGVPDSILLKPGPLNEEDWRVMSAHDRLAAEIIQSAFSCPQLTDLVRHSHAWFGGNPREPHLPSGKAIPLGSRILAIADAFNSMVSDRPYRKAMSNEQAFAELRRCCGTQFDPRLVERFIECVTARDRGTAAASTDLAPAQARLGLEVEKLGAALDAGDLKSLAAAAARLSALAAQHRMPRVAALAAKLDQAASQCDLETVVSLMTDLSELCRSKHDRVLTGGAG